MLLLGLTVFSLPPPSHPPTSRFDRYGKQIWLTEFSCGDNADAKPTSDHLNFMREILPLLDAAPFVYRYAWMAARSNRRGLVTTDAVSGKTVLTAVGQLYNSGV